jgi:hypothetical protein
VTPEYAAFASQKIRFVEELLIQNESRGLLEIAPAMPPISIVVVPIGVPVFNGILFLFWIESRCETIKAREHNAVKRENLPGPE